MVNHSCQAKSPQKTFIHYVFKMTLDEIYTLSDCLMAVQLSKYEVEKADLARLAFLVHQKTNDSKGLMDEMARKQRPFGLYYPWEIQNG